MCWCDTVVPTHACKCTHLLASRSGKQCGVCVLPLCLCGMHINSCATNTRVCGCSTRLVDVDGVQWPLSKEDSTLEARGGERKLAGLPVVCCWCCCCWCCCCRCCAGRCCAGCSAGAGSSAAAAAAGAGWSAAAAAAAALGMLLLLLPPLGGLLLLLVLLLLLPLLRWALQMLGVLQLLGGPAHRAQGSRTAGGGGP